MRMNTEPNGPSVRFSSVQGNQCVWMKNGTVEFRTCENAFDCTSCDFDKGICRKLAQQSISWQDVMRQPQLHRECRHMLTGRVLFHLCSHNFECRDCAYDQQLYEYDLLLSREDQPVQTAARVNKVANA